MNNKTELLELIREELRSQLARLAKAAMAAHEAATDPGAKAESKYDTRSLEQSYLATGQARQVEELADTLRIFESIQLKSFRQDEEIAADALVKVIRRGSREASYFLLAPAAGGLEIKWNGIEITLLSPASPLYGEFFGKRAGDETDAPPFQILEVS